jgi:hypothetical protein
MEMLISHDVYYGFNIVKVQELIKKLSISQVQDILISVPAEPDDIPF